MKVKTMNTATITAGTRPTRRSSQTTGGVRMNVKRIASASGTSTVCAQSKTTTTRTQPANVTHRLNVCDASVMRFPTMPLSRSPSKGNGVLVGLLNMSSAAP